MDESAAALGKKYAKAARRKRAARFNTMPANRFLPAGVRQGDKSQAGSGGAARRPTGWMKPVLHAEQRKSLILRLEYREVPAVEDLKHWEPGHCLPRLLAS